MEKGKAPKKGYYRGSSSNANPVVTADEHDIVADRADAHRNANPVAIANEHIVIVDRADGICIDFTNDAEEAIEVDIHRHFSIRGYVEEVRRNNPRFCSLFPGTNNYVLQFPPLEVPRFRWWRCGDCVSSITGAVDKSANVSEGHGTRANIVNERNANIETQRPSVEASEGHGARANNVNEHNDTIETNQTNHPSVEASEGHGAPTDKVTEPNDSIETKRHSVECIIILDDDEEETVSEENINAPKTTGDVQAASEERGTGVERLSLSGCQNQQARRKSRKIRTLNDLLSNCEPQLCNQVSAPERVVNEASPSVPAHGSLGHEAALPPAVRRKTPNARELGGGRRVKVPAKRRKTKAHTDLEPEWTCMRHRITRTATEMSEDGSLKRAAEMSGSTSSSWTLSDLPLPRDDAGRPSAAPKRLHGNPSSAEPSESARGSHGPSDLGSNPVTQIPVEADPETPIARSSRAVIRDFDLNVPAETEDGTEDEERLRSSNAEPVPSTSMAAGNPIPAQGTDHLPNAGLTPGAARLLIQRPSEPQPGQNSGRLSAFRPYQRPVIASPLVAGSSNQHSNIAECSSSHACVGARARDSRGETEVCRINRNPADFSVVGPRNPFMTGGEDRKKRKKFSRAEKGKGKMDEGS